MKAIRVSEYGGPSVLKLEEVPTPQPGPNQVLVRILAVGVNRHGRSRGRTRLQQLDPARSMGASWRPSCGCKQSSSAAISRTEACAQGTHQGRAHQPARRRVFHRRYHLVSVRLLAQFSMAARWRPEIARGSRSCRQRRACVGCRMLVGPRLQMSYSASSAPAEP